MQTVGRVDKDKIRVSDWKTSGGRSMPNTMKTRGSPKTPKSIISTIFHG
jgi:hypothetical protein